MDENASAARAEIRKVSAISGRFLQARQLTLMPHATYRARFHLHFPTAGFLGSSDWPVLHTQEMSARAGSQRVQRQRRRYTLSCLHRLAVAHGDEGVKSRKQVFTVASLKESVAQDGKRS